MSKKVVLITGTNSGFGWLTANSVPALGHQVYATMRDTNGKNAGKAKALAGNHGEYTREPFVTGEVDIRMTYSAILPDNQPAG